MYTLDNGVLGLGFMEFSYRLSAHHRVSANLSRSICTQLVGPLPTPLTSTILRTVSTEVQRCDLLAEDRSGPAVTLSHNVLLQHALIRCRNKLTITLLC